MPTILIRKGGRPMEATDHAGRRVYRKDRIYLKTHQAWYDVLDYDNHFVYESKDYGSSVMCTCGSTAIVVNYEHYKQYSSYRGLMIVCASQIQNGVHADGSH